MSFLFGHAAQLGSFDLVYTAGLMDYLSDRLAARLIKTLAKLLNPGGRLIVTNFVPGIVERGYMEAIMDWTLKYRTPDELERLAAPLQTDIGSAQVQLDASGQIAYLMIERG
jgi:SAM-dependent methyltransferase